MVKTEIMGPAELRKQDSEKVEKRTVTLWWEALALRLGVWWHRNETEAEKIVINLLCGEEA